MAASWDGLDRRQDRMLVLAEVQRVIRPAASVCGAAAAAAAAQATAAWPAPGCARGHRPGHASAAWRPSWRRSPAGGQQPLPDAVEPGGAGGRRGGGPDVPVPSDQ